MQNLNIAAERRTSTDHVFESLHEEIQSLKLLPGTKMSEVDVASRFGVSRQPVRDAFNRLDHLDLLLIRPQRATVVRGFSIEKIEEARFLRLAVEMEVVRNACRQWDNSCSEAAADNLQQHVSAAEEKNWEAFHSLDHHFHLLLCKLSGCDYAISTINLCRQKTDRLCVLSFKRPQEVNSIIDEHSRLVDALAARDEINACAIMRDHLCRLDSVVEEVRTSHSEYFE